MDKISALKDSRLYARKVRETFPACRVILYGSYVSGQPTEDSDIDIAVIVPKYAGNRLDAAAHLWEDAEEINVKIEPVLLESENDMSGFCNHVIQTGIEL